MIKLDKKNSIASYMVLSSFCPVMRAEGFELTTGGIPDLQSVIFLTLQESKGPSIESLGMMCFRKHN